MASFKLIIALAVIIDVVQVYAHMENWSVVFRLNLLFKVCTSTPISAGNETDVTKMFTPEELMQGKKNYSIKNDKSWRLQLM